MRDDHSILTVTPHNWKNTMRYAIGANYHYSDTVKLRAGLAFDEEAIEDAFRTARIPGNDRQWLSLGVSYRITPVSVLDIGYAHLFVTDATINDDQLAIGNGRVRGEYKSRVDMLSLQYTHNF